MAPLYAYQGQKDSVLTDADDNVTVNNHPEGARYSERTALDDVGRLDDPGPSSSSSLLKSSAIDSSTEHPTIPVNNIRKYMVLLQDCLAIKFVPVVSSSLHHLPFAFAGNNSHFSSPNEFSSAHDTLDNTSNAEVDHSLHGLFLYKGFREANLNCYWNATLCEAVRSLEYKGYMVPSTILVYSLPRFLAILNTAWSRQMLRSPTGYQIEFLGEIEEVIAEPVPQGQFAPLSDSLCWAILELTSSGQEAFVDSILTALVTAFPTMAYPRREVVYQTLEKLIRERKLYQTNRGYFVVTPDTFRFMNSGNCAPSVSTATLTLDALMSSYYEPDRLSLSQRSWGSTESTELIMFDGTLKESRTPLKRHNSLKIIRQKDLDVQGSMARSYSFRLSKSFPDSEKDDTLKRPVSLPKVSKPSGESKLVVSEGKPDSNKQKKKFSFFKWFSFRRSKSKGHIQKPPLPLEILTRSPKSYPKRQQSTGTISSSTQTNSSSSSSGLQATSSDDSETGRGGAFHSSDSDYTIGSQTHRSSKWNSLPGGTNRKSSSRKSILDGGPFYDSLRHAPVSNASQRGFHSGLNSLGRDSSRSSTWSQATSSLGYGSFGPSGFRYRPDFVSRKQSPSPLYATVGRNSSIPSSVAGNSLRQPSRTSSSHRNLSDFHHRQGTNTTNQPRTNPNRYPNPRPKSAYEIVSHGSQQPTLEKTTKKSVESLPNSGNNNNTNPNSLVSSTTVTQNVKSTTSTELELLLPIGKIVSAALAGKSNVSDEKISVSLRNIGGKVRVGEPVTTVTQTEIQTTVNNNGIIETHFDCKPNNSASGHNNADAGVPS